MMSNNRSYDGFQMRREELKEERKQQRRPAGYYLPKQYQAEVEHWLNGLKGAQLVEAKKLMKAYQFV